MRSRISVRFGSPVRASWVARKTSSFSRLVSSSCARWRSSSKDWHIRTRVTSRLRCSIRSASARVSSSSPSSAALSPSTSAAQSRQRRQRLVTSFSGASRWEASWAKIRQDSWPTSRATASPSPAIQRATATVETAPTSSKLSSTTWSSVRPEAAERRIIRSTTSAVRAFSACPRRESSVAPMSWPNRLVIRRGFEQSPTGCPWNSIRANVHGTPTSVSLRRPWGRLLRTPDAGAPSRTATSPSSSCG